MSDLNSCSFTGRLGKDAELKYIGAKQTPCAVFSIACTTGFGQYEKTLWLEIQYWGQRAEGIISYLKKGGRVAVTGELSNDAWVDQNGVKHTTLRLSANNIVLLGSKKQEDEQEDEVVF